jgi:hypothetical protein
MSYVDQQITIGAVVVGSPPNVHAILSGKAMGRELIDPYAHACEDINFFAQVSHLSIRH